MHLHRFGLILDEQPGKQQAALVAAEYTDIHLHPDQREVSVERRAGSLGEAVMSAIDDLEVAGLRPIRVYDDDWVTLADVAVRIGRSRETVRLWSIGQQGPGGFPPPLNPGRDTRFYSWAEVAAWLIRHKTDVPMPEPDLIIANLLLQVRRLAPRVGDPEALRALLTPHLLGSSSGAVRSLPSKPARMSPVTSYAAVLPAS